MRWNPALLLSVVLAGLLAAPQGALASGLRVEPGLWAFSWSLPDPLGGEPIEQQQRRCVRDGTVTTERVNSQMTACRVRNAVFEARSARWQIRCDTPAGPMDGKGSLKTNGSVVIGTVEMALAVGSFEVPVTGSFRGHRIGRCP